VECLPFEQMIETILSEVFLVAVLLIVVVVSGRV
jgi:hypothetical protein